LARGWSSLHPIFKEHRRKSFNYPEKFLPDSSNLKANCGRWAKQLENLNPFLLRKTMDKKMKKIFSINNKPG
jgi:hypothetical protein